MTVSLFLSACSQTEDPTAAAKICNIVDDKEMTSLMDGEFTKEPMEQMPQGSEGCKYISKDGNKTLNYIIGTSDDPAQAKQAYDKAVSVWEAGTIPNRTYKKFDDIGREAFWSYSGIIPQFLIYQDKTLIIITLGHFDADEETSLFKVRRLGKLLLGEELTPTNPVAVK